VLILSSLNDAILFYFSTVMSDARQTALGFSFGCGPRSFSPLLGCMS
jgi:hypothetical protein